MPNNAPVKGTHDIFAKEATEFAYIEQVLKTAAELYAYKEMRTPVLEYTEVFSRGTGESSDIVRKEMYTFLDKGNRSVTMRPEFTAGIMRSIISNKLYINDLPLKIYYSGPAFRYERPQLGRYRQFNQFGVEAVGVDSARADAECIILAAQSLYMLGFKNLSFKVNTIGDDESRNAYRNALKEFFAKHIDEMCEDCHERIKLNPMRILDCKVEHDKEIAKGAPLIKDYLSEQSEKRFYETLSILNEFGIQYEVDDSLVRGLDYYSEIVFEIHATSPEGKDYGALVGGGHYGGLLKDLGGPDLAGVGFAMGIERVKSMMEDLGLFEGLEDGIDLYVMPIGDAVLDQAFMITMNCRTMGFSAETPLKSLKMGAMFKKAEHLGAKFALIIGEEELENGKIKIKDLASQEQSEINLDDLEATLHSLFSEDHCGCGDDDCCCGGNEEGCCCGHHHHEE